MNQWFIPPLPPQEECVWRTNNSRIGYIDLLRVVACFLVVFTHSAMPVEDSHNLWLASISLAGSPSSELFLALSGSIILPVKTDIVTFYKRRFTKLVIPLVFWSVMILLLNLYAKKISIKVFLFSLCNILTTPVTGVYWFIYVMIGLYLVAPVITPFLNNAHKRHLEFFLVLWGINLLIPYYNLLFSVEINYNGSHYWMLNYFGGFLGYWLLGYYLRRYPVSVSWNIRWITCIAVFIVYCLVLICLKQKSVDINPYIDNLQIGSAVLVVIFYTLIQNMSVRESISNVITKIAKYTFGIYLIHIIVVREFVWHFFVQSQMNPFIETMIITIISIALCIIILKTISKIPYGRQVIGW